MLEPYAVKVASTVLRRGRAGNRSFLFDYEFVVNIQKKNSGLSIPLLPAASQAFSPCLPL